MTPWTRIVRLSAEHSLDSFCCGDPSIDGWVQSSALNAQAEGTCGVHLCLDDEDVPIAYFSLATTRLTVPELPAKGNTKRSFTPAIVLAKLGLHQDFQRTGSSTLLVAEVLRKAVSAANSVGGSYILADVPNPLKHSFYLKHDFKKISDRPEEERFFMKMSSARKFLASIGE